MFDTKRQIHVLTRVLTLLFVFAMSLSAPLSAAAQSDGFFNYQEANRDGSDAGGEGGYNGFIPQDPGQPTPLGNGIAILSALGAGYVILKKRKRNIAGKTMMFLALATVGLLFSQCKKKEIEMPQMVKISGTVSFDGSKSEISTSGMVKPVSGDVIYIYKDGSYVGQATCTVGEDSKFTYSGTMEASALNTECVFMYQGSVCGKDATTISFAEQTGTVESGNIKDVNKFHVASCKMNTGDGHPNLKLTSQMALAYFRLSGITAAQTVYITGVYTNATLDKNNGKLTGKDYDIMSATTDAEGKLYLAFIPQEGPLYICFWRYDESGNKLYCGVSEFKYEIASNHFYCNSFIINDPIAVTMNDLNLQKAFSISDSKCVSFSTGNLKWDGTAYGFEASQLSYQSSWSETNCGHFFFSKNDGYARASSYNSSGASATDVPFTNSSETAGAFKVGSDVKDYRLLSKDEWMYLLNRVVIVDKTPKPAYGFAQFGESKGMVLLPDNWNGTQAPDGFKYGKGNFVYFSNDNWSAMETAGAIFLPAAGFRNDGSTITYTNEEGYYWTSSPKDIDRAYLINFTGPDLYFKKISDVRSKGFCYRLVTDFSVVE